jgi:hypothetical protein
MYKNILITLFMVFSANAIVFTASVSQDSMSVGDRILFNAYVLVPKGANVIAPATENGFGKFTIKEWNTGKAEKSNVDSINFNYILTLYTPEQCTIPPVPFVVTDHGKNDTLLSKAMPIRMIIVKSPDSTNTNIAGLRPQQTAGSPSLAWLWIVLAVAGITAGAYFLKRLIKKQKIAAVAKPLKPPYEEALELLGILDSKQYLLKGMVREYAFELSDILKRYIGRRFDVNAGEFTTYEMLDWIKISGLGSDQKRICEWFFSTTDPVKFAKWLPDNDTVGRFGADVRKFLELTRPVLQQTTEKTNAA